MIVEFLAWPLALIGPVQRLAQFRRPRRAVWMQLHHFQEKVSFEVLGCASWPQDQRIALGPCTNAQFMLPHQTEHSGDFISLRTEMLL